MPSTSSAPAQRARTSNPVEVDLSRTPTSGIEKAASRFYEAGQGLFLTQHQPGTETFEFKAVASHENGHTGLRYSVHLGRSSRRQPVIGKCTCAADRLCRHLAAAYLAARLMLLVERGLALVERHEAQATAVEAIRSAVVSQPAPAGPPAPAEETEMSICSHCGRQEIAGHLAFDGACIECQAADMVEEARAIRNIEDGKDICPRCGQWGHIGRAGTCARCDRSDLFG